MKYAKLFHRNCGSLREPRELFMAGEVPEIQSPPQELAYETQGGVKVKNLTPEEQAILQKAENAGYRIEMPRAFSKNAVFLANVLDASGKTVGRVDVESHQYPAGVDWSRQGAIDGKNKLIEILRRELPAESRETRNGVDEVLDQLGDRNRALVEAVKKDPTITLQKGEGKDSGIFVFKNGKELGRIYFMPREHSTWKGDLIRVLQLACDDASFLSNEDQTKAKALNQPVLLRDLSNYASSMILRQET